jgi:hypothetical protein
MALRVARGLFRLWLILSVLWIGGVGYVTWRDFPPPYVPDPQRATTSPKAPSTEFDPDEFLAFASAEERRSAFWFAGGLALVPPAFVLALGSALVWAFRGFW